MSTPTVNRLARTGRCKYHADCSVDYVNNQHVPRLQITSNSDCLRDMQFARICPVKRNLLEWRSKAFFISHVFRPALKPPGLVSGGFLVPRTRGDRNDNGRVPSTGREGDRRNRACYAAHLGKASGRTGKSGCRVPRQTGNPSQCNTSPSWKTWKEWHHLANDLFLPCRFCNN